MCLTTGSKFSQIQYDDYTENTKNLHHINIAPVL